MGRRKRKRSTKEGEGEGEAEPSESATPSAATVTSTRAKNEQKSGGKGGNGVPYRTHVSIAIPGSIVANAQGGELQSYMVGIIARFAAVFRVGEIIVFSDKGEAELSSGFSLNRALGGNELTGGSGRSRGGVDRRRDGDNDRGGYRGDRDRGRDRDRDREQGDGQLAPSARHDDQSKAEQAFAPSDLFMARLLQYLETPQYLRKALFPVHPDLRYAGLLNPLDAPHHLRFREWACYREGVVTRANRTKGRGGEADADSSNMADVGLEQPVRIDRFLRVGTRVTLRLPERRPARLSEITGRTVSPADPWREDGMYWGYTVRLAPNLAAVVDNCPPNLGRYDLVLGTSERGENMFDPNVAFSLPPTVKNLLVVFGGVQGLEHARDADDSVRGRDDLFHRWLNVCPTQGSRTIRTEEAIGITLSALQPHLGDR